MKNKLKNEIITLVRNEKDSMTFPFDFQIRQYPLFGNTI